MAGTCKRCKGMTTDTRERGIGLCFKCEHGLECQPKQNEKELEMSCIVEGRRLYCTTAEVSFGPRFESDEEGEQFRAWMYGEHGDPRSFDTKVLQEFYENWKGGEMKFTFVVKGIQLYSEKEAKITMDGERGSMVSVYVPVEDVGKYRLNQRFSLEETDGAFD